MGSLQFPVLGRTDDDRVGLEGHEQVLEPPGADDGDLHLAAAVGDRLGPVGAMRSRQRLEFGVADLQGHRPFVVVQVAPSRGSRCRAAGPHGTAPSDALTMRSTRKCFGTSPVTPRPARYQWPHLQHTR